MYLGSIARRVHYNQCSNMQNIVKQNTLAIQIIATTVAMKDVKRHWQKFYDSQAHVNSTCLPVHVAERSSFKGG